MVKILDTLTGLLFPDRTAPADVAPPSPGARLIPGGPAASELCMLPVDWDGLDAAAREESTSRVRDLRIAQLKADGLNGLYVDRRIVGGRDGGPMDCALQCQPGLARLESAYGQPMVFDGEYVAQDGFNATLSEHRKGIGEGVFWLYDAVPFDAWKTGLLYPVPIEERLAELRDRFAETETGMFVGFLDYWLLDAGEMRAKAHEIWAAGFEGLVSKRRGSGYARARSSDWRKVKQRHRAMCSIADVFHKDGRVQSIMVRGPEAGGSKPLRLSAGLTNCDRQKIDQRNADGIPMTAEIEFELTVGATRTIRGAKFVRLVGGDAR